MHMSDFPTLQNLFSAYFHQDWSLEHDSADAVVDSWREGEDAEYIARARDELDRLLARDLDDAALGAAVRALGSEYDPPRDTARGDGGWRDWLVSVKQRLLA